MLSSTTATNLIMVIKCVNIHEMAGYMDNCPLSAKLDAGVMTCHHVAEYGC